MTPHLQQHRFVSNNDSHMKMITNNQSDNSYPLMNDIFTRRPVKIEMKILNFLQFFLLSKSMILNI